MRTARAFALVFVVLAFASRARAGAPLPLRDITEQFDVLLVQQPIGVEVVAAPQPSPLVLAARSNHRHHRHVKKRHHRRHRKHKAHRPIVRRTRIVEVRYEPFPSIRLNVIQPPLMKAAAFAAPVRRALTSRQQTGFVFILLSLIGFAVTSLLSSTPKAAMQEQKARIHLRPRPIEEADIRRATGSD